MSIRAGLVQVGHSVVGVVLVLPPGSAEALHHVAPEHATHVAQEAVLEYLVVQKVVRQPSALLPEDGQQEGAGKPHPERVAHHDQRAACCPDGHVAGTLVGIIPETRLKHASRNKLAPQLTVAPLKIALRQGFGFHRFLRELTDAKGRQHFVRGGRVEGSKNIRKVVSGMCEYDMAAGMVMPSRHIIHFVFVHHPGIFRGPVLLHLLLGSRGSREQGEYPVAVCWVLTQKEKERQKLNCQ